MSALAEAVKSEILENRKTQERNHFLALGSEPGLTNSLMDSLVVIEVNSTELCNRKCTFCPRSNPEVYPNRNLSMNLETISKLARDLKSFGYRGRISFSGFGEALLNKKFAELVRILRTELPANTIETNTNGDQLTAEKARQIFDAGLSMMYVNMYDGAHQIERFQALFAEAGISEDRYRLREHWAGLSVDFALLLNNRSGMVKIPGVEEPTEGLAKPCYYPFYKMLLDWDGNVLFCSNDWGRKIPIGSIHEKSVQELWLSPQMREIRARLSRGDRSHSPCNTCTVDGTLTGRPSFEILERTL